MRKRGKTEWGPGCEYRWKSQSPKLQSWSGRSRYWGDECERSPPETISSSNHDSGKKGVVAPLVSNAEKTLCQRGGGSPKVRADVN